MIGMAQPWLGGRSVERIPVALPPDARGPDGAPARVAGVPCPAGCGKELGKSPSDWWCSEACFKTWQNQLTNRGAA